MNVDFKSQMTDNIKFSAKRIKRPQPIEQVAVENLATLPTELSTVSKKLVRKAHNLIEDTWVRIKKKEVNLETPMFSKMINKKKKITLFPLYANGDRSIVLQIDNPNGYQRIKVDKYAKDFIYEKVVTTEFGSVTTASYNSKLSKKDELVAKLVNEILEENLPKLVN